MNTYVPSHRGPGRPPKHDGPYVVVVVDGGGPSGVKRIAAWRNGVFTGDRMLVEAAQEAARAGAIYRLGDCTVTCDSTTPLGALAALCHLAPGRTTVTACPDAVRAWFDENREPCSHGRQ